MSSSALFTVGLNYLIGFAANSKVTNGMGSPSGDGISMSAQLSAVDDRDGVDTPFWEIRGSLPSCSGFGPGMG